MAARIVTLGRDTQRAMNPDAISYSAAVDSEARREQLQRRKESLCEDGRAALAAVAARGEHSAPGERHDYTPQRPAE